MQSMLIRMTSSGCVHSKNSPSVTKRDNHHGASYSLSNQTVSLHTQMKYPDSLATQKLLDIMLDRMYCISSSSPSTERDTRAITLTKTMHIKVKLVVFFSRPLQLKQHSISQTPQLIQMERPYKLMLSQSIPRPHHYQSANYPLATCSSIKRIN